jgi:hypothetical protein
MAQQSFSSWLNRVFSKRMLRWIGVLIAVALLGLLGRQLYLKMRYPGSEAIKGVPSSAILIIEGQGFLDFAGQLTSSDLWKAGFSTRESVDHLARIVEELTHAQLQENSPVGFLKDAKFCMSLVPRKTGGPAFIVHIPLGTGVNPKMIHRHFQQLWPGYAEKRLLEIVYYERVLQNGDALYVAIKEGMLLVSLDREVFELGYYTLESGNSITTDQAFMNARGKLTKSLNEAARVYISYEGVLGWLSRFLKPEWKSVIASLPDMGKWAATELLFDAEGAHLQGFTDSWSADNGIFSSLAGKGTRLQDPAKYLPFGTLFYQQTAIPDFETYLRQYVAGYLETLHNTKSQYPINQEDKDDFSDFLSRCVPLSMTVAATDQFDTVFGSNFLIYLSIKDTMAFNAGYPAFADSSKQFVYQDFAIQPLRFSYMIPALLGERFHPFEEAWVAVIGKQVIIAPTTKGLLAAINAIVLQRTLSTATGYQSAAGLLYGSADKCYYIDFLAGNPYFRTMIEELKVQPYDQIQPFLPKHLLVAYTRDQDALLTDIVLRHNAAGLSSQQTGAVVLDAPSVGFPVEIRDYRDPGAKMVISDQAGFLYLINARGQIEWKHTPPEPPLSALFVIDLYKNGRQQCLFMSRNMLHLVQVDGNPVQGFPVHLSTPFAGHLSVFDYDKNGNYRLVYNDVSGKLANADLNGKGVSGWLNPAVGMLRSAVSWRRVNGADYLIACDTAGMVMVLDRRGRIRFDLPSALRISPQSEVSVVQTGGSSVFAFLDHAGALQYITLDGGVVRNEQNRFSQHAWMVDLQPDNRGSTNVLIADGGKIGWYDHQMQVVLQADHPDLVIGALRSCRGGSSWLASGLDKQGVPFVLVKERLQCIRPDPKNYDFVFMLNGDGRSGTHLVLGKGAMIQITGF